MVSKNQKKLIKSLYQKKYRKQLGLFVAEGKKVIDELLNADLKLHSIFTIDPQFFEVSEKYIFEVTSAELKSISFLTTPQTALAVFNIPDPIDVQAEGLSLALDDVRDPGNMGTIIRLCDWFGVTDLICSEETVDCYNPKVVQATMGSIARIRIRYVDLKALLKSQLGKVAIYGTFMNGKVIYTEKLKKAGIVVMGNEANGISPQIETMISHKITIPQFGATATTESLNVATATAIVLSEFKRKSMSTEM